ncbi:MULTISPECIES: ATP-binding protein [unclassified Blautia]|jgi:signal transduction histidine kinase/ActR/RegA family two-component response regulator|nr:MULTISPECIES: ATP-binding protein [unclassified Blautia]MCJ7863003.1 ATP-binding protein [Blautia sp. NSJ-157]MCJ7866236.1 ATP-binding protein [Blautia sp. NSJ-140]
MDDFKKLTEQLLEIYINAESVNDLEIENYFDENISLIGTGKHEFYRNLHEFLESFEFDVKRRGKIRIEVQNLHQEEKRLDDDHVLAHGTVDFVGLFKDDSICFKMETRFTIIYRWTNGKWLVQHLHQSTPDLEQMDGEEFPVTLGKQVKKTRQALYALGTAYYHISRLNLKTGKIELVKRSRKMCMDIKDNTADWDPQFEVIESIIAEPFVQKYIDFFDIRTMAARLHNKESMSSEFKKKNGSWFLSMVVPQSYDKNGNVTSVLIANRDVTDEKMRELRQEEELREAKLKAECANKAKSAFLFNMSHDIRTPMNAIIGYADLATRHLQETEKLGRYLEEIQICGKELLSMLGNVLDLARIENNKVEMEYTVSNVRECFENCVTMFRQQAESKNQTLSLTEQIMYPYVYMDAPHLSEICLNIISNAIKYTNTGGTISCSVLQESCKEDWCNMIITITDNGIGMSEEFQKHIFDAFERERNSTASHIEGSGIGMGITKKLIELMNGTIEVKSKQGEGSSFTVTVPCRKALKEDTLEKKNTNLHNKNCLNGVRILLVEDNEINIEIARELLTEEGCLVETANDGVACIDMIEKADADYYKLILMDIQMPVMNGYDATLAIRKMKDTKKSRIPIIAMTANAFAEDVQKVLSVGMNDHVAKPVDINILVSTMMKYL